MSWDNDMAYDIQLWFSLYQPDEPEESDGHLVYDPHDIRRDEAMAEEIEK